MCSHDIFASCAKCLAVLCFYHANSTSICLEHSLNAAADEFDTQELEHKLTDNAAEEHSESRINSTLQDTSSAPDEQAIVDAASESCPTEGEHLQMSVNTS